MEKEIIEILKSKMNEADIYGMEVLAIDINDINALAKELNDLFALRGVGRSLPTKEQIDLKVEEYGFRVPYDGSNSFYDDQAIKHFTAGVNWYKQQIDVER